MNYGYGAPPPVSESTLFQAPGVLVTNTRFVSGNRTFPMNGITSVSEHVTPSKRFLAVVFMLFSAASLLIFIISAAGGNVSLFTLFWVVVWAGLGAWRWIANPTLYHVVVQTAGTNVSAITSPNIQVAAAVSAALNQAIVMRG